mgnify:CR=1 FL=1|jgi:hypothetical protein|nr:MAG TPA: hypothetical protein [Caudoviricetes sp.]
MIEVRVGPVLDLIEKELETMDEISPQNRQLYQAHGILQKAWEDMIEQAMQCNSELLDMWQNLNAGDVRNAMAAMERFKHQSEWLVKKSAVMAAAANKEEQNFAKILEELK